MSSESSLRQPCFYSMLRPRWRKEVRRKCTLLITSQISCLAHLHKRCHAALIYILILTINQITIVAIPHSAKPAESDHNAAVPLIKVLSFFVLVLQFTNFWFSLTAFIKLISTTAGSHQKTSNKPIIHHLPSTKQQTLSRAGSANLEVLGANGLIFPSSLRHKVEWHHSGGKKNSIQLKNNIWWSFSFEGKTLIFLLEIAFLIIYQSKCLKTNLPSQ